MGSIADDFSRHMSAVAYELLGDPNPRHSTAAEKRYGTNGSLSIDLEKGTAFDHESKEGGGVLWLIGKVTGLKNGAALEWMRLRGFEVGDRRDQHDEIHAAPKAGAKIVATYDYVDALGDVVFQVVRYAPKTFRQRRRPTPDDAPDKVKGGWVWSVKGVPQVPYRLPELEEALGHGHVVFIAEGEKDVDNLAAVGLTATCNAMGAGKWPPGLSQFFAGADVVILPDNDDAGRDHAELVASELAGVAQRVRILELPDLAAKGDVSDWLAAGGTVDTLHALVDREALAPGEEPKRLHFGALWFGEAVAPSPEPEWLVDDILTLGDMSLVYGATGSGKSFLATDIAMAIARGVEWFGRKVRPGGVLYIAAEGQKGFRKRLRAYCLDNGIKDADRIPFLLLPRALDLFATDGDIDTLLADLPLILERMRMLGVELSLIVIDTYAKVSRGANENASEDVSRVIGNFERLKEAAGHPHLMIVHHKNAGGEHPRGHTSLLAGIDNAIDVQCDEARNRTARIEKMKDGEAGMTIGFRLESVELARRDDGRPITSCVVVPASASRSSRTSMAGLAPQAKIALRALREAILDLGEPAPSALKLPLGIRVVRYPVWRDRFAKIGMAGADGGKASAIRQAMHRSGDQLLARGIIGRDDPFVWIAREPEGEP